MKSPTAAQIRAVMSALGSRTSPRKAKSSAENGRKGGRPRKCPPIDPELVERLDRKYGRGHYQLLWDGKTLRVDI